MAKSVTTPVIIGDCSLYLGDCRDILPILGGVDAVVTDPPYGIAYQASQPNAIEYGAIKGDEILFNPEFLLDYENLIIWGGNNFANKLPVGGWIVWDKRCTEAADKMMGSPFELAWCSKMSLYKIIRVQHGGAKNADALNGEVANEARFHPTQKPITVMCRCLDYFPLAKTILDPFMGSGSTGIACAKTGKQFIGIEIEPKYFDIACERIRKAYDQPDFFVEPPKKTKQEAMI